MKYEDVSNAKEATEWLVKYASRTSEEFAYHEYTSAQAYALLSHFTQPSEWLAVARCVGVPLPSRYEEILARDPRLSEYYAREILKGPFPLAEATLAKDVKHGLSYALNRLKGRFPAFEALLYAEGSLGQMITYAMECVKGRIPEVESRIAQEPEAALRYARYVLEQPWPDAEPSLLSDILSSVHYADYVLNGRWPALEERLYALDEEGQPVHLACVLRYHLRFDHRMPEPFHSHLDQWVLKQQDASLYPLVVHYACNQHHPYEGIQKMVLGRVEGALEFVKTVSHSPWPLMEQWLALIYPSEYLSSTQQPFGPIGEEVTFAENDRIRSYYEMLSTMPASDTRNTMLLLTAAYSEHPQVEALFQEYGLEYRALWPLWEGVGLNRDERKALLQALLSSPTQEVGNAQSPIELISMEMDNP